MEAVGVVSCLASRWRFVGVGVVRLSTKYYMSPLRRLEVVELQWIGKLVIMLTNFFVVHTTLADSVIISLWKIFRFAILMGKSNEHNFINIYKHLENLFDEMHSFWHIL